MVIDVVVPQRQVSDPGTGRERTSVPGTGTGRTSFPGAWFCLIYRWRGRNQELKVPGDGKVRTEDNFKWGIGQERKVKSMSLTCCPVP